MTTATDPDDEWPSVGTPRTPSAHSEIGTRGLGRRMRRAFDSMIWFGQANARAVPVEGAFDAECLIPALSSIRSSAEILRDTPDIDAADRRRFAEIVLAEEARLEALVAEMTEASRLAR
jgi:hypothetical protein